MFWFSLLFRFVMVFYFVYTFFELATISAVFYFDDLFTVNANTLLGLFGFIILLIFFLTFFFDVYNLLVISVGPLLVGFFSISLLFGFVLINDLFVSDVLDLLIELPLSLTGFFYYTGVYFCIFVILKLLASYIKPGLWVLMNLGSLTLLTAGFLPGIILAGVLFCGLTVSACYTGKPMSYSLLSVNES